MRLLYIFLFLISSNPDTFAQTKRKTNKNVKIKYTKNRKVDLGALSIDGDVIAPGDFSIDDESDLESNKIFIRRKYRDKYRIYYKFVF